MKNCVGKERKKDDKKARHYKCQAFLLTTQV